MRFFALILIITMLVFGFICSNENIEINDNVLHFATSAEYPPFEYKSKGKLKGFDIELGKLIAEELGQEVVFDDLQFASILPALSSGQVDAAISTLTITEERKKKFDFSVPYYFEGMAVVYKMKSNISHDPVKLAGKKISVQLGSTMEIWLKKHAANEQIIVMDNNILAVEALKSGHVDVVLMDTPQAKIFCKKNPGLSFSMIANAEHGYAIALQKNSKLTEQINQALVSLEKKGALAKLKSTWLEDKQWKN